MANKVHCLVFEISFKELPRGSEEILGEPRGAKGDPRGIQVGSNLSKLWKFLRFIRILSLEIFSKIYENNGI